MQRHRSAIGRDADCSSDKTMTLSDNKYFRSHCSSALTHPVTVAALVVLLLNDGCSKSLWPDSWVTGQAERPGVGGFRIAVAGVRPVAVPEPAPRSAGGRRSSLRTLGLPALYAAFNTFEPVHDRILWGLSLVAGGTAGSPIGSDRLAGYPIWPGNRCVGMAPAAGGP